ncbi:hypothetical protein A1QI_06890 [Vibrio genomosp. F10 str. 9ZB36]|nr:hypothetical protein A1QI_06890 [Vibrio genomosp. F10 str. 9ZB36]
MLFDAAIMTHKGNTAIPGYMDRPRYMDNFRLLSVIPFLIFDTLLIKNEDVNTSRRLYVFAYRLKSG